MKKDKKTQMASAMAQILQISDFHLFDDPEKELLGVNTFSALEGVIAHIRAQEFSFDLVVDSGDISQDGTPQSYEHAQQLLAQLGVPVLYLPGNHDHLPAMQQVLAEQMGSVYELGDWQIVALDTHVPGTNQGYLNDEQLQILEQAVTQGPHQLVALHHNPLPIGSAWLDPMMIANATRLLKLCEEEPSIRGLIWGHVRQEMDTVWALGPERRQLRLLACPATCLQFAPRSQQFGLDTQAPGYRVIDLGPDGSIGTQVIRVPNLSITPHLNSGGY